jgi:hypothetical protein
MVMLALQSPTRFEKAVDLWYTTRFAEDPEFEGPLAIEWREVA